MSNIKSKKLSLPEEAILYKEFEDILTTESMIGFSFVKPNGYAGDFELIDRIYQQWSPSAFQKWDDFYHNLAAARAVRNRKEYLIELLKTQQQKSNTPRVLNLGSGPCSDVLQFFQACPKSKLHIDCLDMDKNAILYASGVCDNYIDNMTFINKNAFRFKPDHQYEFIWSAGLFDYFSDKLFVRVIK